MAGYFKEVYLLDNIRNIWLFKSNPKVGSSHTTTPLPHPHQKKTKKKKRQEERKQPITHVSIPSDPFGHVIFPYFGKGITKVQRARG